MSPVQTANSCNIIPRCDQLGFQESRNIQHEKASDISVAVSIDRLNNFSSARQVPPTVTKGRSGLNGDIDTATILSDASTEDRNRDLGSNEDVNSNKAQHLKDHVSVSLRSPPLCNNFPFAQQVLPTVTKGRSGLHGIERKDAHAASPIKNRSGMLKTKSVDHGTQNAT